MRWCCYVHPLHFVHNQKSFPNRDHQTAAANQTQTVPSSQIDALCFATTSHTFNVSEFRCLFHCPCRQQPTPTTIRDGWTNIKVAKEAIHVTIELVRNFSHFLWQGLFLIRLPYTENLNFYPCILVSRWIPTFSNIQNRLYFIMYYKLLKLLNYWSYWTTSSDYQIFVLPYW